MKTKITILILSTIVLTEIICIAGLCICKGQDENNSGVQIREIPQQTVLYTICRGDYYQINDTINGLYAFAKLKGMQPCGQVSTCYLNSPVLENVSHRLIEIQIPVEPQAIEQAGTLGYMTDVKIVPAMKVAVVVKLEGSSDPTEIITNLFSWINKKGYVVRGRMCQTVLDGRKGSYHKLRTEFLIPIDELPDKNLLTLTMDPCFM